MPVRDDDYERGYADGHAEGFLKGSLAARKERTNEFTHIDGSELTVAALRLALLDLEDENARLIAKLRGYVLAGSAKGPGVFKHNGTVSARGLTRKPTSHAIGIPSSLPRMALGSAPKGDCGSRIGPRGCPPRCARHAGACL